MSRFSLGLLGLAALNLAVVWRLFFVEYLLNLGSIEPAFFAISRWMLERPTELAWFPWWYGGIPLENAYPPLMHAVVAIAAWAAGWSPALAHHVVGAVAYCLGPPALALLAWRLSRDVTLSLAAGAVYALISPAALLVPPIGVDMDSVWEARRLHNLTHYGEGPHVFALTLIPWALVALDGALERRQARCFYLAALLAAAVVLTNWIGAVALAAAAAAYLFARLERGFGMRACQAAAVGLLAYAFACRWLPPSMIATVRRNAQLTGGGFPIGLEQVALGAALLGLFLAAALLLRRRASLALRFSVLLSILFGGVVLHWGWTGGYILPQPFRFQLEMEAAFALLAAFSLGPLVRRLGRPKLTAAVLAGAALIQFAHYQSYAARKLRPLDITESLEYEAAALFAREFPGDRVYAAGSTALWLNVFADNPQLGGGFDQGITNPKIPLAYYGVHLGVKDGGRTADWLRAFGVRGVLVSGPASRDIYPQYQDPDKFEGLLPLVWCDGDDRIYRVPQRAESLVHAIPREAVPQESKSWEDVAALAPYLKALEHPIAPRPAVERPRSDRMTIRASLVPGQVLSVQISHDPGWRALVGDVEVPVGADGLGQMVVEPGCGGDCVVELIYDGGRERALCFGAFVAAALGAALFFLRDMRRGR